MGKNVERFISSVKYRYLYIFQLTYVTFIFVPLNTIKPVRDKSAKLFRPEKINKTGLLVLEYYIVIHNLLLY